MQIDAESERETVLAKLREHGWNSTSFQVLEPGFRYWFDREGCVAYVDTGSAWVAAGAPIARAEALGSCASHFAAAARAAGRRACFFAVERRFVAASELATLLIGEQPVWDPHQLDRSRASSKSLREQLRRARAKGVRVRRLEPDEVRDPASASRHAIEGLIGRWNQTRQLAPMGFLVAVHPFHLPDERRYFVAERDGRVVAFLAMVPVYARQGWLLEDFLRDPRAPNGTVELVIDSALRSVADEDARYATLGLAPLSGNVNGWLRAARDASGALYDFRGLRAFKQKLRPDRWDEVFLAFPAGQSRVLTVVDVLRAFSRVGLLRFGVETLLRVPGIVLELFGALLLAWAIGFAAIDPERWFSAGSARVGWAVVHVALAIGLLGLARRFRPHLALGLACAFTLDALGSFFAVVRGPTLWHHAPELLGAAGVLALPGFAAFLLWRGCWFRRESS